MTGILISFREALVIEVKSYLKAEEMKANLSMIYCFTGIEDHLGNGRHLLILYLPWLKWNLHQTNKLFLEIDEQGGSGLCKKKDFIFEGRDLVTSS